MIFHLFLKAYAVTALMKIYGFEIVAGRKVDMLPEVGFQTLEGKFVIANACSFLMLMWLSIPLVIFC